MAKATALSASLEDYLEAIYHLVLKDKVARSRDIADRLHVTRPSVTGAIKALAEQGLVNYAPYGVITLTDAGERLARDVVRRHDALKAFFVNTLLIEEQEAEEAACRMEHAVSAKVLERLTDFVAFLANCPRIAAGAAASLRACREHGHPQHDCTDCIESALDMAQNNKKEKGRPDKKA